MELRSEREYRIDRSPEQVWAAIGRVDAFQTWWPWLRRFEAVGLEAGDRWDCTIRPPLPYALRLRVLIEEAIEPSTVVASVSGDIAGRAVLRLEPVSPGCSIRLTSTLAPARQPLRAIAACTPWLARYGHDWVLDTGFEQFRARTG